MSFFSFSIAASTSTDDNHAIFELLKLDWLDEEEVDEVEEDESVEQVEKQLFAEKPDILTVKSVSIR
jgi:hypothetical protein